MEWVELCATEFRRIEELIARGKGRKRLQGWLDEAFLGAFRALEGTAEFRAAASWSLIHLFSAASGQERRLLLEVDQSLRRLAAMLQGAPFAPGRDEQMFRQVDLQAVACAAGGGWIDLVRRADYFAGLPDLHLHSTDPILQEHFKLSQMGVGKAGDRIHRFAFGRIVFWRSLLEGTARRLVHTLPAADALRSRLTAEQADLDRQVRKLESSCFVPAKRRLREAAATLVQAYAAFEQAPQLDWLPGGFDLRVEGDRFRGTWRLGPRSAPQASEPPRPNLALCRRIAACLDEFKRNEDRPTEQRPLLEDLKHDHLLVVVEGDRPQLFWKGELLEIDWIRHRTSWELLLRFAKSPGRILGAGGLCDAPTRSQMSRLTAELILASPELESKFATVRGAGYRLELHRADVCVVRSHSTETYVVVGRRPTTPERLPSMGREWSN